MKSMVNVIADDKIPFLQGVLEPFASVRYLDARLITREIVADADALLIRTRTTCNESLLGGSTVKFIATATIGYDHIDTRFCDEHSIAWTNSPGCNAASVQQYIASVLANLSVKQGITLAGKTLGIIGVGHVGKKVESLARLLGMNLLLNDPPRARNEGEQWFVSFEKLLHESDIVTLHVPLNRAGEDKTFHMISTSTFEMMKQGAWLINSSRGEVVDERALEVFLDNGRLSGAILDVWENEPSVNSELLEKIAIATPHIAGYSLDGKQNATVQIVRTLAAFFHFPFLYWEPGKIHAPEKQVISLDCQNQGLESTLCQAILHTCDVMQDDLRLRQNPASFEKLRGNYPVRREFPAYSVSLINDSQNAGKVLKELGFQVI